MKTYRYLWLIVWTGWNVLNLPHHEHAVNNLPLKEVSASITWLLSFQKFSKRLHLTKNDVFAVQEVTLGASYEKLASVRVFSAVGLNKSLLLGTVQKHV